MRTRIDECKGMIYFLIKNAKNVPSNRHKTVIDHVDVDSFNFVMSEVLNILDGITINVEVTEHHTFAKPDDVEDLDFPNTGSEDKQLF